MTRTEAAGSEDLERVLAAGRHGAADHAAGGLRVRREGLEGDLPRNGDAQDAPRAGAHGARMEEVGGTGRRCDARRAGRLGHAHDRAEVARILNAEEKDHRARAPEDLVDGNVAPPGDGEQVLRRLRVGEALEDLSGDELRPRTSERRQPAGPHARVVQEVLQRDPCRDGVDDRLLALEQEVRALLEAARDLADQGIRG